MEQNLKINRMEYGRKSRSQEQRQQMQSHSSMERYPYGRNEQSLVRSGSYPYLSEMKENGSRLDRPGRFPYMGNAPVQGVRPGRFPY